jgi:hypothetical protein
LKLLTRYVYCVPAARPLSPKAVVFAGSTRISTNAAVPVFRSTRNPCSFVLLSLHASRMLSPESAVAVRSDGAPGSAGTAALAVPVYAEKPPALEARTR